MSLLMNALKKAETAKQAVRSAEPDSVTGSTTTTRDLTQELGLDPPQRSAPLESASTPSRPGPLLKPMELTLEPDAPPAASAAPSPRGSGAGTARGLSGNRSKEVEGARAVFAAKQPKPRNPQLPFFAVVGVCLLTASGYGAYLWWQMQPPRPVMAASPAAASSSPSARVPAMSATPVPAANAGMNSSAGTGADGQIQVPLPVGAPVIQPPSGSTPGGAGPTGSGRAATPPVATTSGKNDLPSSNTDNTDRRFTPAREARRDDLAPPRAGRRNDAPARDAATAAGGAPVESPANLRIARNATTAAVNPDVLAGYAALQAGDLERAGSAYDRALRADPANRDALLGAATVLLRLDRTDAAEAYFRQTLRLHPGDVYATAQLASLTAQGDPVGALSQVNSLIAREAERPEGGSGNGTLAFVQGNQLSSQARWPEAQQAYFNAHRADPGNADYCYNLAISLDRMREPRLARDFYIKALDLARLRPATFDTARARARLTQLEAALK